MKIRKADGSIVEVADLQDGDALTVPTQFMDSARDDGDIAYAVLETIHAQYRDDISNAWRSGRWQDPPSFNGSRSLINYRELINSQAALEAAHAQYRRELENRWRA